jgi:hypothetical protein
MSSPRIVKRCGRCSFGSTMSRLTVQACGVAASLTTITIHSIRPLKAIWSVVGSVLGQRLIGAAPACDAQRPGDVHGDFAVD